jgi:uncharacterized transporter YbjL
MPKLSVSMKIKRIVLSIFYAVVVLDNGLELYEQVFVQDGFFRKLMVILFRTVICIFFAYFFYSLWFKKNMGDQK